MEKRIILALLLSMAVMFGFQALYQPKPVPPAVIQGEAPIAASPQPAASAPEATPSPVSTVPGQEIQAAGEEDVRFDSRLYTATIGNRGGVLKSFKLKEYTDANGQAIELIDAAGAAKLGWPLTIATTDPKLDEILNAANFAVQRDGNNVVLEFASTGIHSRKSITFDPQNYTFSIVTTLTRDGRPVPHSIAWRSGFGDQSITPVPVMHFLVYPSGSSYTRLGVTSVGDPQEMTVSRFGIEDQYFLAMFLLPGNGGVVKITKQEYPGADGKPVVTSHFTVPSLELPIRVYVGPKDPNWLKQADEQLVAVVDYGYFGFIAKPLTVALLWLNSYISNFGWSIILLTVIINLALFPLRLKQQVSMQKMQKVQPQMKTLQDKYKKLKPTDPKRAEVQSQMMGLYKEHGINPMSGCLPLLLQMPFLIAFYTMLSVSIELRHAPWMLWITDLSQPDHLFILPILMALSMFITQKMTPTTVDPAQAKIMMIMPLMFSVMFLWSQSGLILYWLTSNVVGIGQQFFINKYWAPVEVSKSRVKRIEPAE